MKRHERRQLKRDANKKQKDKTVDGIQKYAPSLKNFHEEKKGTLFDWMKTLKFEDLNKIIESPKDESDGCAFVMYLALMANMLATGSNHVEDENPDTEDSTLRKIVNHFILLANLAILSKAELVEFAFDDDFFNFNIEGFPFKIIKDKDIPKEYKKVYDMFVNN